MTTIYILECQDNKYYIGRTNNIDDRLSEHFTHKGSEWTKKYPPIRLIEEINDSDNFEEDKQTKMYMANYGIDNVRGGTYSMLELTDNMKTILELEINEAKDNCLRCGRNTHYMKSCKNKTHIDGTILEIKYPNRIINKNYTKKRYRRRYTKKDS